MPDPKTVAQWLRTGRSGAGPYVNLAVALSTLAGLVVIAQSWLLAGIVDAVIFRSADLTAVMPRLWALLGLFLLRAAAVRWSEQLAFRGAARVKLALRDRLFRHLQALGPVGLAGEATGELANTLVDGVEALEAYYARYLPALSLAALLPLAILAFVFPLDWISGLVLLCTAPLIPLFMILIGKGAERLNQRQWRELARMSAHFLDMVQGLTTLKLFNASRREAELIARISDEYRRSTMSVLRVAFLSSAVLEFFATVSIAVVAVLIGFRLLAGRMDFLRGFFVLLLAPELYLPLRSLGTHYHARLEALGAAEQILDRLENPAPPTPKRVQPTPTGRRLAIRFEDVHFAYEPGREALAGLSFKIRAGERTTLVGPSGAGKTTVVNLLLGFIRPDAGHIRVGGTDLAEIDPEAWRAQLAWVPQSPRLFHGTVLDNILLGRPDADMGAVETAARNAGAEAFIRRLPGGWEAPVGESGLGLSGGQVQRIALARAFLRDAPLVIFDEPTASLDTESEQAIARAIERLAKGRTVLTVAHRLRTVRDADRILVIADGRLAEEGRHDELGAREGLYRRMLLASGAG